MANFTNTSDFSVHVKGLGLIGSGESIDIPADNESALACVRGLSFFSEDVKASKKSTKKASEKTGGK